MVKYAFCPRFLNFAHRFVLALWDFCVNCLDLDWTKAHLFTHL